MTVAASATEDLSAELAQLLPPTAVSEGQLQYSPRLLMRGIAGLALILVLAVTFYFVLRPAKPKLYSIAVLPALNLTQASSNQSVADSLSNILASQLPMLAGHHLRVVAEAPADSSKSSIWKQVKPANDYMWITFCDPPFKQLRLRA